MDIDRLKQKAHMSGQFAGLAGPSAEDLADIESEDVGTGIYTPEQIEGLRRMNEKVDPAYARQRAARSGIVGGVQPRGGAEAAISRVRGGAGTSGTSDKALTTLEGAFGTTNKKGEVMGVQGGGAEMGSSGDELISSPSMKAVGMGAIGGGGPSHFEGTRGTPGHAEGIFLLRTAGRCNHPRCQMIRAKGMELLGADTRMQTGGKYWEANEPEIPSVATEEKYLPMIGGKERKGSPRTTTVLSPADPKHPEWLNLQAQAKSGHSIFNPSDLLAHHHGPEDEDFEKYPLPF